VALAQATLSATRRTKHRLKNSTCRDQRKRQLASRYLMSTDSGACASCSRASGASRIIFGPNTARKHANVCDHDPQPRHLLVDLWRPRTQHARRRLAAADSPPPSELDLVQEPLSVLTHGAFRFATILGARPKSRLKVAPMHETPVARACAQHCDAQCCWPAQADKPSAPIRGRLDRLPTRAEDLLGRAPPKRGTRHRGCSLFTKARRVFPDAAQESIDRE
jgi:hypothetical protein